MTSTCTTCERPTADMAFACPRCTDSAYRDLTDLADAVPAARDVAAGLAHRGAATRGSGGGSRLPLDLSAIARLDSVTGELGTWVRHVAGERGDQLPAGDPLEACARYLAERLEWLRHRQEAPGAYRDFAAARRVVLGIAVGPGERRWLGQCGEGDGDDPCTSELYARVGAITATCHGCGTRHDVRERRRWLDGVARGYSYTAREIELAYGIRRGTIRVWVHRELLAADGDTDGQQTYPLGLVLDLAASDAARRAEAQARRARRATEQGGHATDDAA